MGIRVRLSKLTCGVVLGAVVLHSGNGPSCHAQEWYDFSPSVQQGSESQIDLRLLNEKVAGESGFVTAKDGQFVLGQAGQAVRFWAVNGPPQELKGKDLQNCARQLAKYGVNLVRVHTPMFDKSGEADMEKIRHAHAIVAAMKAEGIYTHFSIYFPLWFTPATDLKWLEGYDGQKHPFAALMFNSKFQQKHREWLKALLATPDATTGKRLVDEPAVFGVELQNEDSLFFWTFDEKNIPDVQLRMIETQFGDWLKVKYGAIEKATTRWGTPNLKRDAFKEGRVAMRPLWNIANEKTARDQDTAEFLLNVQSKFYKSTYEYLRSIEFRGLIHASNWATASPEVLGPLEKLSYTEGDLVDRHGYFECNHHGDNAAWSLRSGHTFSHRSALRFDADAPGKPKQFVHPVMDPQYDDKPSMISETTFTRPNRFRSEAPIYFAAYGALQDTDCIVHFALDGDKWSVKPGFWMQQWTLASPAMLGQFPAAALMYRNGYIKTGETVADLHLRTSDLFALQGTPLPQDASFDELRLKDVPTDGEVGVGKRLDPLLHYVGRARVHFESTDSAGQSSHSIQDLKPFINRQNQTVKSSTRELNLDYGKGLLTIDSPKAQGASGNLKDAGAIKLKDITIESPLDLGHVIAVSMDNLPIAYSKRILLQVMTEERTTGFATESAESNTLRIQEIGRDPWQVKQAVGTVTFNSRKASQMKVTPLDHAGVTLGQVLKTNKIELKPTVLYYLITN